VTRPIGRGVKLDCKERSEKPGWLGKQATCYVGANSQFFLFFLFDFDLVGRVRAFLITSRRTQNGWIVNGIRTAIPSPTSACTPERGALRPVVETRRPINQALLLKQFPLSLKENALEWYMAIPPRSVADWELTSQ